MVFLTIVGAYLLLIGFLGFRFHFFGEGARSRQWIKNNKEFSAAATRACRILEAQMIANRYEQQLKDPSHELKPLNLKSIRFTERKYYNFSRIGRLYPDDAQPINARNFDVALIWYRQFKYKGDNPPLFFDPHYDIEVTCFVLRGSAMKATIASEYIGQ